MATVAKLTGQVDDLEGTLKAAHAAERQLHERISLQQAKGATEHKGRMDELLDQVKAQQERVATLVEREHEQTVMITKRDAEIGALTSASKLIDEQLTAMRTRVEDGEKSLADAHERERKLSDEIQQLAQQKSASSQADEQNASVLLVQVRERVSVGWEGVYWERVGKR